MFKQGKHMWDHVAELESQFLRFESMRSAAGHTMSVAVLISALRNCCQYARMVALVHTMQENGIMKPSNNRCHR